VFQVAKALLVRVKLFKLKKGEKVAGEIAIFVLI
jgi:hypothetical protein